MIKLDTLEEDIISSNYLPLGNASFPALRRSNKIYVDKTKFVYDLAKDSGNKFFLRRPRRFGKSLLISTFESLFKIGLQDFNDLYIFSKWQDKGKYSVLKLDLSTISYFEDEISFENQLISNLNIRIKHSLREPGADPQITRLEDFAIWLSSLKANSLVVLIDEYDAPLTACLKNKELFIKIQNSLLSFYRSLNCYKDVLRFLFITGITTFSQQSVFYSIDGIKDISFNPDYGSILGFTEDELYLHFKPYLKKVCDSLNLTKSQLQGYIESHYGGFCFDDSAKTKVISPWSILKFFDEPSRGFRNYWMETSGYGRWFLTDHNDESLDLYRPGELFKPKFILKEKLFHPFNDGHHLYGLPLLVQTGFLTIKNADAKMFEIGFPNSEVAQSIAGIYRYKLLAGKTLGELGASSLGKALIAGDSATVIENLNKILDSIDYRKYPVKDIATLSIFLRLIITLDWTIRTRAVVHDGVTTDDIEVNTDKAHWMFLISIKEEVSAIMERRETFGLQPIAISRYEELVTCHKKFIPLQMVYSEKRRRIIAWNTVET